MNVDDNFNDADDDRFNVHTYIYFLLCWPLLHSIYEYYYYVWFGAHTKIEWEEEKNVEKAYIHRHNKSVEWNVRLARNGYSVQCSVRTSLHMLLQCAITGNFYYCNFQNENDFLFWMLSRRQRPRRKKQESYLTFDIIINDNDVGGCEVAGFWWHNAERTREKKIYIELKWETTANFIHESSFPFFLLWAKKNEIKCNNDNNHTQFHIIIIIIIAIIIIIITLHNSVNLFIHLQCVNVSFFQRYDFILPCFAMVWNSIPLAQCEFCDIFGATA